MLASAFAPRSHRRQGGDALQWLPKRAALASDPVLPLCSMRSTGKTAGCPCAAACDHHGLTLTTIARLMTAKTYQRADSGLPLPISRWTASMTTISPPPSRIDASASADRFSARSVPEGMGLVGRPGTEPDDEERNDRCDNVPGGLDPG